MLLDLGLLGFLVGLLRTVLLLGLLPGLLVVALFDLLVGLLLGLLPCLLVVLNGRAHLSRKLRDLRLQDVDFSDTL